ncbi:MAG: DMT family transporter [Thermodesulfobacteriota bacterium]
MNEAKAHKLFGYLAILGSAFLLYLSAVVIRWSEARVDIHPAFFLFAQYFLGYFCILILLFFQKKRPTPDKLILIIGRTIGNALAVLFLYKAVTVTTVAAANILNMTYPLFVGLFTYIFMKDQRDPYSLASVVVAWGGIWLILAPGGLELQMGNLWGLASGVFAAIAVMFLSFAGNYDEPESILYYMFGLGAVFVFISFPDKIHIPDPWELYYLCMSAVFSVIGQYLLTMGFRFVTAVEGSVLSSTRILMAAFFGPILASDQSLGVYGWAGALLIFGANGFIAVRKAKQAR